MVWSPEVTVAAIVEHQGRYLIVEERAHGRIVLNQPAGHIEEGETLIEAVVRETREETACAFVPQWLIGAYLWRNPNTGATILRFAFNGELTSHDPDQPLDEGILRTLWLDCKELRREAARLRSPMVLRGIDDYVAGARYPLSALARLDHIEPVRLTAQQ